LYQAMLATFSLGQIRGLSHQQLRLELGILAEMLFQQDAEPFRVPERDALVQLVFDEVIGYGPITSLFRDQDVSDILINGPRQIFIEKAGQLVTTSVSFRDEEHLLQVVRRMVASAGRQIDEKSPMVDARLPDGSRLNAVLKPLALNGPL